MHTKMLTKPKTDQEIDAMRESGRMLALVLQLLRKEISAGMSTKDLANLATAELKRLGGSPAFLGYQGFPDVLCVSVNDEVVHGIPRQERKLAAGDIVGLDFGVVYKGMITDAAISVIVGEPRSARETELIKVTEQAMYAGIDEVKNGVHVGDIGAAVQAVLDKHRFGIVRDLVGHGVGHEVHEEPNIPNYGIRGKGMILTTGMTIAIEPMSTLGGDDVYMGRDDWTILTRDGSRSAHFEHTILVTPTGPEILTQI